MRGQHSRWQKGVAALACLVIAYSAKVHAEANNPELTAQNLHDMCTDNSQDAQRLCGWWIYGFARGMEYSQILAYAKNLTGEQARLSIEKYMRDHPEKLNLQAVTIAGFALALAFPCEK